MTQILATATGITIDSAILIYHVIHNNFIDNPEWGKLDVDWTDHCFIFVEGPFSCKKVDDTETT